MDSIAAPAVHKSSPSAAKFVAWGAVLAVSILPDILFRELGEGLPAWLPWAKIGLLGAGLLFSLMVAPLRTLRLFFASVFSLYLLQWAVPDVLNRLGYQLRIAQGSAFTRELLSVQIPRFTIGVLLVLVLLVLTRDRRRFFFTFGQKEAIAAPIPLIMTRATPWKKLGPFLCACLLFGMGVIAWLMGSHPSLERLSHALPLLPFILLMAASNSFGEELNYRAAFLAGLESPAGAQQALAMTAIYFGVGHYYGVPYGVIGVLLSTFMGWLLGKSMLETRGFFWPWIIHVCLDTVIFIFMAVGSISPGG